MTDIIKDAKRLLDSATPAPWEMSETEVTHRLMGGEVYEYGGEPVLIVGGKAEEVDANDYMKVQDGKPYLYPIHRFADCDLMASAPELAQTLAEETYFYGVQVWMGGRWIMMLTRDHGTSIMHRGKWFERKDEAEECAATWSHDTPTRIVRQRRSPVEVINE